MRKLELAAILDKGDASVESEYAIIDSDGEEAVAGAVAGASPAAHGTGNANVDGFCVECEDFCEVCFHSQHRKGSRKQHSYFTLTSAPVAKEKVKPDASSAVPKPVHHERPADSDDESLSSASDSGESDDDMDVTRSGTLATPPAKSAVMDMALTGTDAASGVLGGTVKVGDWFVNRAKYIPLRLTLSERKFLRLLEAALNVSEYTDKIDILTYSNKTRRQVAQIQELCSIISGLVLAADYKVGQQLFKDKNFEDNEEFFRDILLVELGRRHKIMNPEKMRNVYGKMIYVLQDSQIAEVKDLLSFSLVGPIKTVYSVLEAGGALALLEDDLIVQATKEIIATPGNGRMQVQKDIKAKERAIETLGRRYANSQINSDQIKQCLYSIGDNHAFLRTNRDPCDKMISYLKLNFNPEKPEGPYTLAIQAGRGGARLSHDHKKQYNYVIQSLTLWREILHDMFMLWYLAESDLLSDTNPYRLRDTGQGLNRLQAAPKTSRLMHTILHRAQQKVGYWVGSSVIHMGDTNVPNALMFIDKYTQIYRILLPIVRCLDSIDELANSNEGIAQYFDRTFGGIESLKKLILSDFFRHAFDGSGADNFFSAGSCIDGRLTSAWNWCSTIEKKEYFHVFLLSGFVGFDGEGFGG
ncbi:hypothetical protein HDU83_000304 [Entophlyctis luteolus]|nr:hypothetical protein HDU83_000304 [Entophlyctis luteolus]KAJ3388419.1 hypothetical protein HDU84_009779 [Entophlyctis sp. JEL0112]